MERKHNTKLQVTFRNVARSFVTIEGFALMLSCMMDVKLKAKGKRMMDSWRPPEA